MLERLIPKGDVGERTFKSAIWSGGANVIARLVQMTGLIVLAQFLPPRDFGLFGIALVCIAAFERFSKPGLKEAMIHYQEEDIDEFLDSVFIIRITRGLLIFIVVWLLAPFGSQLFQNPAVTDVLRVLALKPLIVSLHNPAIVYFEKELKFHKLFLYRLSQAVTDFLISIGMVLIFGNVWAIVIGLLGGLLTRLIVSYIIHGFRPSFSFDSSKTLELVKYSKWITASSPLTFLISQGDDAFVGIFLGSATLGLYQVAYRFSNAPATEIVTVINRVLFPTYSKIQNDTDQLATWYRQMVSLTATITVPIAAGLAVVAPYFVGSFFGDEWEGMVPLLQILAFYGLVRSLGTVDGALVRAIGRPDISTKTHLATSFLIAAIIYPLTMGFGIFGTTIAVSIGLTVPTLGRTFMVLRLVELSAYKWFISVLYPVLVAALMTGVLLVANSNIISPSPLASLIFSIILGAVLYTLLTSLLVYARIHPVSLTIERLRNMRSGV